MSYRVYFYQYQATSGYKNIGIRLRSIVPGSINVSIIAGIWKTLENNVKTYIVWFWARNYGISATESKRIRIPGEMFPILGAKNRYPTIWKSKNLLVEYLHMYFHLSYVVPFKRIRLFYDLGRRTRDATSLRFLKGFVFWARLLRGASRRRLSRDRHVIYVIKSLERIVNILVSAIATLYARRFFVVVPTKYLHSRLDRPAPSQTISCDLVPLLWRNCHLVNTRVVATAATNDDLIRPIYLLISN